jgi:UPF0176 protein
MTTITNIATYRFVTLDQLTERRAAFLSHCAQLDLRGTILLSQEGINLFLAGNADAIERFRQYCDQDPALRNLDFKMSYSATQPFKRLKVKIKREIVTFGQPNIDPARHPAPAVTPKQLKAWLDQGEDIILLDTRNDYETRLGRFKRAIAPNITHFRQFPAAVNDLPDLRRDQKIVAYCTGGIRCEKAAPWLMKQGYVNVFQLEGGILRYFEECGTAHYEGDCFVFDERVALDTALAATHAPLCPTCQRPAANQGGAICACLT